MTAFVMPVTSWWTEPKTTPNSPLGDRVNDCGAVGTRKASSRWLKVFLLLAFCFAPVLMAQGQPRTIHVFVALADNKNQGIVPVAAILGNGDDPQHNLYWGSAFGYKTFFSRSADWRLVASYVKPRPEIPKPEIMERCVFKHRTANVYLVADAYQGNKIRQAIVDFLEAAAGGEPESIPVKTGGGTSLLKARGAADLVAYAGHDGLMDFQLTALPQTKAPKSGNRQAIILACISKSYFSAPLRATGAIPLVWTTGLMAPEAYTLKSAIDGWILHESNDQIRERAAVAYDKYQRCGLKGARRLLVTGW
jgi:hypothetical protein